MVFLDPTSDIAFKKLFGDIAHKNILLSFLNSILEKTDWNKIVDVVINDPNNLRETKLSKLSIVDVRCTDQMGNQYIVEMQVEAEKDYAERAQYYSSLALSRQLTPKDEYEKLVPVIFIGVLNFNLFSNADYLSHHFILNKKTLAHDFKHLEFHVIELKKFNKNLDELHSIADKWIYFLKNAWELTKIPTELKESVLRDAFDILEQGNWSKAELEAYDRYVASLRLYRSGMKHAIQQGMEKGIEKGIKKGMKQGIKEGKKEGVKEGRLEAQLEFAKNLLDILDIETIAKKTGLTIDQIKNLKKLH